MKKYLIQFWKWLSIGRLRVSTAMKEDIKNYKEEEVKTNVSQTELDDELAHLELDKEKYRAITKCKGCVEEVFVLKLAGEDIGYYPNLNRLAIENKFKTSSVYYYWHTKPLGKLYLGKYEIVNLK